MRRAGRVDGNQAVIVDALRKVGAEVAILSACGDGIPDLLVSYRNVNTLLEIKDPSQPPCKRRLTPAQERFHARWRGPLAVVETPDDALRAIGAK